MDDIRDELGPLELNAVLCYGFDGCHGCHGCITVQAGLCSFSKFPPISHRHPQASIVSDLSYSGS